MLLLTQGKSHAPTVSALRLAALAAILAVAGCDDASKFAPPCPQTSILGDAADLVRYRAASPASPTGHDVTDMVMDARITGISGHCSAGEHRTDKVLATIAMEVTRGPAAPGRQADISYFIAVTKGDQILDKQVYPLTVQFPPNIDVVHITSPEIQLNLPTDRQISGAAYTVLTGFQLSPEELAANRTRKRP